MTKRDDLLVEYLDALKDYDQKVTYEGQAKAYVRVERAHERLTEAIAQEAADKIQRERAEQIAEMLRRQQATRRALMTPSERLADKIDTKLSRFGARLRRWGR